MRPARVIQLHSFIRIHSSITTSKAAYVTRVNLSHDSSFENLYEYSRSSMKINVCARTCIQTADYFISTCSSHHLFQKEKRIKSLKNKMCYIKEKTQ